VPVFNLLRDDSEVFCLAGATRCTNLGEIWRKGVHDGLHFHAKFHFISAWMGAWERRKLKILVTFFKILKYMPQRLLECNNNTLFFSRLSVKK